MAGQWINPICSQLGFFQDWRRLFWWRLMASGFVGKDLEDLMKFDLAFWPKTAQSLSTHCSEHKFEWGFFHPQGFLMSRCPKYGLRS
eukprot:s3140_g8.t1